MTTWDLEDWQAHYDERAAIIEYDGKIQRSPAEILAFNECVAKHMAEHPGETRPQARQALSWLLPSQTRQDLGLTT